MHRTFSRASFPLALAVLASLVTACASKQEDTFAAAATAGSTPPAVDVRMNSMYVTVENHAGQPLLDVQVALRPPGRTQYTTTIRRLESGEKRELPLAEFAGPGDRRFEVRGARPREVAVTAVDLLGKRYDVTVPWTDGR